MSQVVSPSTGQRYRVACVCRSWDIPRSTVYAHKDRTRRRPRLPANRGPKTPWTDAELTERIRTVLTTTPFLGEGHRKVWARLRLRGVRTSRAHVLRCMREAGLLAPTRVGRRHGSKAHDGTLITERPDRMWGTDATSYLTLNEGTATVFIAVDHCTAECIGIHAARPGTRFEAWSPYDKESAHTSEGTRKGSLPTSLCGTITAANTGAPTSRASSASSASR